MSEGIFNGAELQTMRMDSMEQRIANLERARTMHVIAVEPGDVLVLRTPRLLPEIVVMALQESFGRLGLNLVITTLDSEIAGVIRPSKAADVGA